VRNAVTAAQFVFTAWQTESGVLLRHLPGYTTDFVSLIDAGGSRIRAEHQISNFASGSKCMSTNLDTNEIVRLVQQRATAELRRELDEVKWWEDRVRRGLVKREHAEGYIQAAKRIIRTKRHVLGFPEFPC
jgi:hypothetical protein